MDGVSILIPTYNRKQIVIETVVRLLCHIKFDGHLEIIVSADGDDGTYEAFDGTVANHHHSAIKAMRGPRQKSGQITGLGANLNQLLNAAVYPIIMQMDDDHWLNSDLDINRHVTKLLEAGPVAWIRLMGVGYHNYHAKLVGDYWHVDWDSPELYIPSNRPHLKHRRFHDFYGYYPEGLTLGETEEGFCHVCKDKAKVAGNEGNLPHVCVPVSLHEEIWMHVGDSWQMKGE